MRIIVGSQAMKFHNVKSKAGDTDIWTNDVIEKSQGLDICIVPSDILNTFSKQSIVTGYATPEDCLAIKLSHLVYDIFWWKHLQDVLLLQSKCNYYNIPLYNALVEYWKDEHEGSKSHLSLYKTKDQFFDDFVPKQHEHDYLHELVAKDGTPVYTKCLKNGQEVLIDKNKFDNLPYDQQVRMFKEEVAVIALERWVIPSKGNIPICQAWNKSLHKTVVSLTKGWASRFIVENIVQFISPLQEDMNRALSVLNIYKEKQMNFRDFEKYLKEVYNNSNNPSRWGFDSYEAILEGYPDQGIKLVDSYVGGEGGEGGAEDCESILLVEGKYYKVNYSYYSQCGFELDYAEVKEVKPAQKTVTVYE